MENENKNRTVAGNAASELTDEKINSVIAMFGKYVLSTGIYDNIFSIFDDIYNQVQQKISPELRKIALDIILDAIMLIGHGDSELVSKSHITVESTTSTTQKTIYFSAFLSIPAGINIAILHEMLNSPYEAHLYWIDVFDGLLELQFEYVM